MTIQQAYRILGVTEADDDKAIKLRFRKLIAKHHPDAAGTEGAEHLEMAKLLNEAYALLRKRKEAPVKKEAARPAWKGKERKDAFTDRTVYMSGVSWEGEVPELYEVARGRYEWDPAMEEFACFLKSLNEAVLELLEGVERKNGIYNEYEYDVRSFRYDYQLQLFHLLAGQFIAPVDCLNKLITPEEADESGRKIYKMQAFLGVNERGGIYSAMSRLNAGDLLYPVSLKNNRIMVCDRGGVMLGHLSFAEDQLYYVVIPILQKRMAKVKLVVKECSSSTVRRSYRSKVTVDLYLRMEETARDHALPEQNSRIQEVLSGYDGYLKKIVR